MRVCNCSMFCSTLLYVHSSIAIILVGKRELNALLNLSSWGLVMVERLFLAVPRGCLQFVIVVFPDHTHLLFYRRFDALILTLVQTFFMNVHRFGNFITHSCRKQKNKAVTHLENVKKYIDLVLRSSIALFCCNR